MKQLLRYFKGYRVIAILAPIFKLIEAVLELITPILVARIADAITTGAATPAYVWQQVGLMVLISVCGLGFSLTCQYLASRAGMGFSTAVRRDMMQRILSLSHRELGVISPASLATRMTQDTHNLQQGASMAMRLLTRSPFLIVGSAIGALLISPLLSLIFLAVAVVLAVSLYFILSRSAPLYRDAAEGLDDVATVTRESLSGARVIKAYCNQELQEKKAHNAIDAVNRINLRVNRISALLNPVSLLIVNLGIIAILWWGGGAVSKGTLTTGEIIALVNYMTQIQLSLVVLANLLVLFTRAAASAKRVNAVLALTPSMQYPDADPEPVRADPATAIALEDVSFSYGEGPGNSLEHISLTLPHGGTLGIIGGTGSGKSTLVNLLVRNYDATQGTVRVYGTDVRALTADTLRRTVAVVPQRVALMSGTVRSNLLWRKPDATDEELWSALEAAQAKDFVAALDGGLDAPVQQNGRNFSGGQRQRLTVARALVGRPDVIILDDSCSALDAATDRALRAAIRSLGLTTVLVAQRAGSLMHCDEIIVLDDGEIAGRGTHDALLSTCDIYREIYESQIDAAGKGGAV